MVLVYHILSSFLAKLQEHIVVRVSHEGVCEDRRSIFWIEVDFESERRLSQFFAHTGLDATGV